MSNFKIFGQEPAALTGVVEAILAVLLSFGVFGLDQEHVAVIVASVSALLGLVVAYATKDSLYSAVIGFTKAVLVLAAAYGLALSDNQTSALIAVVTIVGGLYLREKTSSLDTAVSNPSPGAVVLAA